ncbi:MAG: tetratricopeptide repeat protein [Flavobacteriales bacterium]|nr:tetratricopeptide repeat protein [Flavobacteriales bacterium]MCB9173817.1 tetratricopeptide repeat protein [Flavobacteriales bacterium]
MSKKNQDENSEVIVDVQEVYSKTEHFIDNNKKTLSIVVGAIVVVIGIYFAYTKMYIAPMEIEAQSSMFMAEKYFEKDSLDKAINGDGINDGFVDIIENYGGTKSANLAHYYLGICYLKTGLYEEAIDELSSFSSNDIMISSIALGAIGDAHMELGNLDDAIKYYEKAANNNENELTTPMYLFKAGIVYEEQGDFNKAFDNYTTIKNDYAESSEGRTIEKYLARAEAYKK